MNVSTVPALRARHTAAMLVVILLVTLATLTAAAPALATADGVRIIPDPPIGVAGPFSQNQPDVSWLFLAYQHGSIPPNETGDIDLKYLGDASAPTTLTTGISTPQFFHAFPKVLYDPSDGKIYVVWQFLTQSEPWNDDIMIWRGTWNGTAFVTEVGFPKVLVSGTQGYPVAAITTWQRNPDIGFVKVSGAYHIVVTWEDSRDYGPDTMRVYWMDLTADTSYLDFSWPLTGAPTAGAPIDPQPVWARAQYSACVGQNGVYWLDDRWSWPAPSTLMMDTAVMHADLSGDSPVVTPLQTDTNHDYDNGQDSFPSGGPVATADGATWRRVGPYGSPDVAQIVEKSATPDDSAAVGVPLTQPWDPATFSELDGTKTAFAAATRHAGNVDLDYDIAFWDSVAKTKIMVCDRGSTTPGDFRFTQMQPTVGTAAATGPAASGYRVVWPDLRVALPGDEEDTVGARLYQAFVPNVAIKLSKTGVLSSGSVKITATVAPDFTGTKVRAERVTLATKYGARAWRSPHTIGAAKLLAAGSTASWTWHPSAHGTYYVRIYFYGGTKYASDGTSTTGALVPHVPSYSKVLRVTVH